VPSKQLRVFSQAQNRKGGETIPANLLLRGRTTRNAEAGAGDIRRIAQRGPA